MRIVVRGHAWAAVCTVALCAGVAAQPGGPPATACPAGYWEVALGCFNDATGDVALTEAPASSAPTSQPSCRPGSGRLHALCHNSTTGDVELAEEPRPHAGQ